MVRLESSLEHLNKPDRLMRIALKRARSLLKKKSANSFLWSEVADIH